MFEIMDRRQYICYIRMYIYRNHFARGLQTEVEYLVHPNALKRAVWDMIGAILIGFEYVATPLQLLDIERTQFLIAMEVLVI